MAAPSTTTSFDQASRPSNDNEPLLDISVLKELARKALIDSLNAVSSRVHTRANSSLTYANTHLSGEWCEDVGSGCFVGGTAWTDNGGFVVEGALAVWCLLK